MSATTIGFIGLGVMGGPMCENLLRMSGANLVVYDLSAERSEPLRQLGARVAASIAELTEESDTILMSLPGGPQIEAVLRGPAGVIKHGRRGQIVIDHSTAPVALTRALAGELGAKGMDFADAPVARTREAARAGTLSISVGATPDAFQRIRPLLETMASDVVHAGPVGCGQIVKILNNMVLFDTVVALAEAMAMGERAGIDRKLLFEALSKGSADSFALRNHGFKAMVPEVFPDNAFAVDYALKDVGYALDLAREAGIDATAAELARSRLEKARDAGFGRQYFPVLARVVERREPR